MNPELTPGSRAEKGGQSLGALRVEHTVYSALGDRTHLGGGDGEEVEDEGERLPVEVTHALDPAIRQHDGVVRNGVELAGRDPRCVLHGVPRRAVDLRGAAQRVGVLDQMGRVAVGRDDGATGEHPRDVAGARELAPMRTQRVKVLAEDPVGAEEGLDGHRRRHVRGLQEYFQVLQRQEQHRKHAVGAVDEGEPLFRGEFDRFEARASRGPRGPALVCHFGASGLHRKAEADVGEGGEVAARAHGAVFGDGRDEASVQER